MFGTNPVTAPSYDPQGQLWVHSIFYTIQGEGPLAGHPAVFLRLAGCNLRCSFCDTDFESNRKAWRSAPLASHINAMIPLNPERAKLCVITGGEPLAQNIVPIIEELWKLDISVQIETAGTVAPPRFDRFLSEMYNGSDPGHEYDRLKIVCSPKTARIRPEIAHHAECLKYIVSARMPRSDDDGLPLYLNQGRSISLSGQTRSLLYHPPRWHYDKVWVQPCDEQDELRNRENRALCASIAMRFGYRISIQQHKILELE